MWRFMRKSQLESCTDTKNAQSLCIFRSQYIHSIVMYTEYGASCNNHVHVLDMDIFKKTIERNSLLPKKRANKYATCTCVASSSASYYTLNSLSLLIGQKRNQRP